MLARSMCQGQGRGWFWGQERLREARTEKSMSQKGRRHTANDAAWPPNLHSYTLPPCLPPDLRLILELHPLHQRRPRALQADAHVRLHSAHTTRYCLARLRLSISYKQQTTCTNEDNRTLGLACGIVARDNRTPKPYEWVVLSPAFTHPRTDSPKPSQFHQGPLYPSRLRSWRPYRWP